MSVTQTPSSEDLEKLDQNSVENSAQPRHQKVTSSPASLAATVDYGEEDAHRLLFRLFPFLLWMRKVRPKTLKLDFYAGVTSAIFALPQGLAFALIAGLPPEFGLYAAIVAPIVSAFFGSSWHAVSGPTVATSIVVVSILSTYAVPQSPHFIGFALMLTLFAGLIQLALGVFRLGHIVNFISHTVILGFSTGAAVLIMSSQLKDFLGISFVRQENVAATLYQTMNHLKETDLSVLFLSASTFIVALLCNHYLKKLPYLLVAMVFGGLLAFVMQRFFNVAHINMIGALPKGLPSFTHPELAWHQAQDLFASAIALATLGLIQAVSIAKTVAIKTGQPIDANQEFIGQGMANIACSFTSGFFSSGSFTRTGVNVAAGAVTPMSSVIASAFILLLLIFGATITQYLPTAAMSAIIMIIGYKLIDTKHIRKIFRTSRTETAVFIVTLLSTLFLSLEFAIYSGMFLSLLMYLQKTSTPTVLPMTIDRLDPYHRLIPLRSKQSDHPDMVILRVDGSIFFGSVEHIRKSLDLKKLATGTYILLICESVNLIDISGAELLLFIKKILRQKGGDLYLSGLTPEVRRYLVASPYWKQLGARDHIFDYQAEATETIMRILEENAAAKREKEKEKKITPELVSQT